MPDQKPEVMETVAIETVNVTAGVGASLSPDGLSVYAMTDGTPTVGIDNTISVSQEHHIHGDIGPKTGHIAFEGHIIITGTVREGFYVKGVPVKASGKILERTILQGPRSKRVLEKSLHHVTLREQEQNNGQFKIV